MQLDVHAPAATVGEALLFSGRLRFGPEVDDATVNAFVVEVPSLSPQSLIVCPSSAHELWMRRKMFSSYVFT